MAFYGIIADDFTGSCDAGIYFRVIGRTIVASYKQLLDLPPFFDVLVVNTESRTCTLKESYRRVKKVVESLDKLGGSLIYKKIDSTLRGNIGVEIEAAIDTTGVSAAIVAPAFPANGRTTRNGQQLLMGKPIHKTEFADDPLNPVRESNIKRVIEEQTSLKAAIISLEIVRGRVSHLKNSIRCAVENGYKIVVTDAETQIDLRKIATVALDLKVLPCGSAGLALEVSSLLSRRWKHGRGILIVSGSIKDATLSQISYLENVKRVKVLTPDISRILFDDHTLKSEVENLSFKAADSLNEGENVVISLLKSKAFKESASHIKGDIERVRKALAFLGETAALTLKKTRGIAGLILVGGDTATAVLQALKVEAVELLEEVLPGMPRGRLIGGSFEGIEVITKAGGFGDIKFLAEAIMKLREE